MNFATAEFLVFLPAVWIAYWLIPANRARKLFLLGASYYFYACWDWRFLGLIALSTAIDFCAGIVMQQMPAARIRKAALVVSLVSNLGILAAFKYANFFADSLAALASSLGFPLGPVELGIVLPVGISFYTFQSMSYTIDLYRGRIPFCRDPFDFALFVSFFPQLVAGPIVRAAEFLPQLRHAPAFEWRSVGRGFERIVRGLAKKVVIADSLAVLVDAVFAAPEAHGALATWAAAIGFALQLYCDFSAYSDIAIGVAQTLGYRLPENFDSPYLAKNVSEFWRRWHISLSSWLRDYLYIPLGGSRGGARATYRNLIWTMVLGGLWHGAAWTYVIWGIVHGATLAFERLLRSARNGVASALPAELRALRTFAFVAVTFVIFRAGSMADVVSVWQGLAGLRGLGGEEAIRWSAMWLTLPVLATHAIRGWEERLGQRPISASPWARTIVGVGALLGAIAFWEPEAKAFIYFRF